MATNYKQMYAIQKKNEQIILNYDSTIPRRSGIYFLTRKDEDGIVYFYIGQSVNILQRLANHLSGYQHIDISLRKRGLCSVDNPHGWVIHYAEYPKEELDKWEQYWILECTKKGWQARYNKTSGSQHEGKEKINEYRPAKGYYDGIRQGKITLARELRNIIDKHLIVDLKPEKKNNKVSIKAFEKFIELIDEDNYKETDNG